MIDDVILQLKDHTLALIMIGIYKYSPRMTIINHKLVREHAFKSEVNNYIEMLDKV